MKRIVVGVDGSAGGLAALRWAIEEAAQRGDSVEAVRVWQLPASTEVLAVIDRDEIVRGEHEALAADVAELAAGSVDVATSVLEGRPATVLLERAEGADLLVVGARGHGGFMGLLLGSVSHQVVSHAPCPVVVVRQPAD